MYIYLESTIDNSFYIGQTNNLKDRLIRHNKGYNKSTKKKKPYVLKYFEEFETRTEAMHREWELKKKYNTERRRKLISSFDTSKLTDILGL